MENVPMIEAKNLMKYFDTPHGKLHAVDDVSFKIAKGTTMGVVGESGCGKSTLGRTIIHLLESTGGQIFFNGEDITKVDKKKLHDLREQMQIIFRHCRAAGPHCGAAVGAGQHRQLRRRSGQCDRLRPVRRRHEDQRPAADAVSLRAFPQSGIMDLLGEVSPADSRAVAAGMADELGLTGENIDAIQNLPYEQLAQAWKKTAARLVAEGVNVDWFPVPNASYPGEAMRVGFSEKAKSTPLIVGGVVAEQLLWQGRFYDPADSAEVKLNRIRKQYGEGAGILLAEFQKAYPDKDINDLMYLDSGFRKPMIEYLDARVKAASAPTYVWMLTYDFPVYGGLPAWHGSNHALTFNQCIAPVFHEPGSRRLAVQMSQSWAAFAHTGDPNNPEIPDWKPYTAARNTTMIFDTPCREGIDYDRALILAHAQYRPRQTLRPNI